MYTLVIPFYWNVWYLCLGPALSAVPASLPCGGSDLESGDPSSAHPWPPQADGLSQPQAAYLHPGFPPNFLLMSPPPLCLGHSYDHLHLKRELQGCSIFGSFTLYLVMFEYNVHLSYLILALNSVLTPPFSINLMCVISYCIQDLIVDYLWQLPQSSELTNHWIVQSESCYLEACGPVQTTQ